MRTLSVAALGVLMGCAGVRTPEPGIVTGRVRTLRPPVAPESFTFMDRTYVDRVLRVDSEGGVADAALFLEGPDGAPWVSGRVAMTFGPDQFDPRVAFVSPGEAVEVGDSRDERHHEIVVNLPGLPAGDDRVHVYPDRRAPSNGFDRVSFCGQEDAWIRKGRRFARGRRVELTFDRPAMVPLDWD